VIRVLEAPRSRLQAACALALFCIFVFLWYRADHFQPLPYQDSFASGRTEEWRAMGGAWSIYNGAIRNDSDERGAKYITGSADLSDYSVDADIFLLGQDGDAGLIVRSSDEEEGVDSYSGYYVGLRDRNNTLTIGRADHGWIEYQTISPRQPLHSLRWYHLHVVAVGCDIAAVASDFVTADRTYVSMHEQPCARTGRFGLRSYSSGGIWKNIRVVKASANDIAPLLRMAPPSMSPGFLQTEAGFNSILQAQKHAQAPSAEGGHFTGTAMIYSLGSLKAIPPIGILPVTVRGSVTLTSPRVYLQDATGGVAVDFVNAPPLKIGDQVEATGKVEAHRFSGVIRDASAQLLWQRSPAPPMSVTATQAAMGLYDAMFIETEGEVESWSHDSGGVMVLLLESNHQSFRAILYDPGENDSPDRVALHSVVRVRGVCVVDQAYTGNLVPFAVLLRTPQDIRVLAGPPWWDFRNLLMIAVSLPIIAMIAFFVYLRAERWRLHAVLEERSQMAREIHDTLAQGFAAIAFQLESGIEGSKQRHCASDPIGLALQMAERSRSEAHLSIAALRALHIDAPLGEVLLRVLKQQVEATGLSLRVEVSGNEGRLPVQIEANILRIVQESVANTIQHANATKIDVHIACKPERLHVEVCDDGCGFNPQAVPGAEDGHFGITGLYERAARIQASLSIFSDEHGTRIVVEVPLPQRKSLPWKSVLARVQQGFNWFYPAAHSRKAGTLHGQTNPNSDLR
jgi:signal transduction histidine kinase